MIIDFHTHVFPDKIAAKTIDYLSKKGGVPAYSDGTIQGLINQMELAGVDISVTLPVITNPAQFDSVNSFAKEINLMFADKGRRLISFAGIHPECNEIDKKMDTLLNRFGIIDYKDKKIKELSKGNQQKIQFILAILNKPKLLILDEPFSGLDPFNVEMFKKEIKELSAEGSMIIFSSHRMEHVELFCEKLVVLVKGKSVING